MPNITDVIGIQRIFVLLTATSTIIMIKPANPPRMANIHANAVKKTIPETNITALLVSEVADPPSRPNTEISKSITAQIKPSAEITSDITESTVGTDDGFC